MKNTRNINRLGRQAGVAATIAILGLFVAGPTRVSGQVTDVPGYSLYDPLQGKPNLLGDPDFELQPSSTLSAPWRYERNSYAQGYCSIQRWQGTAFSGANNAQLTSYDSRGVFLTQWVYGLQALRRYRLEGWVRCTSDVRAAYLGVYQPNAIIKSTVFGGANPSYRWLCVDFTVPYTAAVRVYIELKSPGTVRIDALKLREIGLSNVDLVNDPGFENQTSSSLVNSPWLTEGAGVKGIEIGNGAAAAGAKNAYIVNSAGWAAIKQRIAVKGGMFYLATVKVATSWNFPAGKGELRIHDGSGYIVARMPFSASGGYQTVQCYFTGSQYYAIEGDTMMTLSVGYTGTGSGQWIRVDEIHVTTPSYWAP